jgi:hypothetical protein
MPSMFDSATRAQFQRRIASVTPSSARRWGRLSPQQMVCHLSDQVRVALGDIPTTPMRGPMRYWPLKQIVIGPLPWPHGAKSPPETWTTKPGEFERDKATLRDLLDRLGSRSTQTEWPDHPLFGKMTRQLWGQLTCKHFNHHLTQFSA